VKTETLNGSTTTYSYNAANELTSDGTNSYSYDFAGNRNMTGYQTGTGNELKNDGTWTYSYDAEGILTQKSMGATATTWYYAFDNNNQMTSATEESSPGGTVLAAVTYVYDALQNRIEVDSWTQSTGLTPTRMGYDGNQVWVDINSSNQLQTRYLHSDVIDQLFARINSAGVAGWYLTDRQESIRGMAQKCAGIMVAANYLR
jgi:hypothetical protein